MREIKFRAWHKKYKWFGTVVWLDISHNKTENPKIGIVTRDLPPDGWDADEFELKDVELMQYTGLKDKNGVEIYEDDIVTEEGGHFIGEVKFGEYTSFGVDAKDEEHVGWFAFRQIDGRKQPLQELFKVEVIGNIYENPELLRGK